MRLRIAALAVAICAPAACDLRADDFLPPRSLSDPPAYSRLSDLIDQLDHRQYRLRNEAEAELVTYESAAITALLASREQLGPEGTLRGVRILERLLVSDDLALSDEADEALQDFQEGGGTAGEQATIVLDRHGTLREERVIERIRALGGDVRPDEDFFMEDLVQNLRPDRQLTEPILRPQTIWLYPEWSGGVEGLDLLKRLSHLQGLVIYQIRGNELSLFDVQPLVASLPGATVVERGPACLGIKCAAFEPCIIQEPTPGGAAELAGLRQGDEILAIDSVRVRSFNELIDELSLYDPGDIVTLSVRKGFQGAEEIELTLSHWRDINEAMAEDERRDR